MTDDAHDDDVVELTPDLIAGEAEGEAELPVEAPKKKRMPPPSSPFTLLVQPKTPRERESVIPDGQRVSRPSFVPDPKATPVSAVPIRKLGEGTETLPRAATADATAAPGGPIAPAVATVAAAADGQAPSSTDEPDDEILDLGQEYVVDGQVSDAEVGTEPILLTHPDTSPAEVAAPAMPAPAEPKAASVEPPPLAAVTVPEEAEPQPVEPSSHPFDFGTPEMVFDRVAETREDLEEVDDAEIEEAAGEVEAEEIDLAEVEEVTPPQAPLPLSVGAPTVPGAAVARKRRRKAAREWWASIFDDDFLAVMPAHPKRDIRRELDLVVDSLGVEPGGLVLDLACGAGRHAIGMARRNYRVVGVDLSLSMLARAGEMAQEAGQKINFIHGDMRDLGFDQTFDGVYCLGTSFGFFDDQVNVKVIEGVHRALKPGGNFLLEIANRDHAITRQPNLLWFEMGDVVSMEETDFNYINSRLYVNRNIILDGGQRQTKHEYSVRLYALHEIGQIMHNCGFAVTRVSGHASSPGAFFGVDSQKLIIVAQRRR